MNYFDEFTKHLMEDEKPSIYFDKLVENNNYPKEYPYDVVLKLKDIEQNPKYHPEGDVWTHTMMVVDEAAKRKSKSKNPKGFMWAALLHDVGKLTTTKERKGRITSYDHDKVGARVVEECLNYLNLREDEEFCNYVITLVRLHMQILFVVKDNGFAEYERIMESGCIEDIGLLGICDRLGRGSMSKEDTRREEKNIEIFLERCDNYIDHKETKA